MGYEFGKNQGEKNAQAKLTWADVEEIRRLRPRAKPRRRPFRRASDDPNSIASLADRFGVSKTAISQISNYVTWTKK